jgi:hypothetical protein
MRDEEECICLTLMDKGTLPHGFRVSVHLFTPALSDKQS